MKVLVQRDNLEKLVLHSMKRLLLLQLLVTSLAIGRPSNDYYDLNVYENPETRGATLFETPSFLSQQFSDFYNPPPTYKIKSFSSDSYFKDYPSSHSAPIVRPNFYYHSAPEEKQVQYISKEIVLGEVQHNYNVIFIKAPKEPKKIIKIKAVYPKNEDKTAIYVLHKTPEDVEVKSIVEPRDHQKPSSPEVFFIKYKTDEEALRAQNEIRAQYDNSEASDKDDDKGSDDIDELNIRFDEPHDDINDNKKRTKGVRYTNVFSNTNNENNY